MFIQSAALACLLALLLPLAHAEDVFKWVDENGKIHYGDAPPAKKKASAQAMEFKNLHPTEAQRQQAAASLARSKALLATSASAASSANETSASASASATKPSGKLSCKQAQKLYEESITCFKRYTDMHHVVQAQAYKECSQVPQPEACRD